MERTGELGASRCYMKGFLVDDPMSIDPSYFFDAQRPGVPQAGLQQRWSGGEEALSNETWYEDGEELFHMPLPRVSRGQGPASVRPRIAYPYPWLAEPED
jgi:hypothetical protein